METLETLFRFTDNHPQIENEELQYTFLGGTAIRLAQEDTGIGLKRPISDFDLLVLKGERRYPTHQCTLDDVFGSISIDKNDINCCIKHVNIRGKDYYYMDGEFLTVTKTCAIDNPREKDFEDINYLYKEGLINFDTLNKLYKRAKRITKNSDLVVDILRWFLDHPSQKKIELFQTFPQFVNLLDEFKDHTEVKEIISNYSQEDSKTGYQKSTVFYNIHSLIRELRSEHDKRMMLSYLLETAKNNDYTDFDRIMNLDVIPKFRHYKGDKSSLVREYTDKLI